MSGAKAGVKRRKQTFTSEELTELPKNELIERIKQLEAHNKQLKGILSKHNGSDERENLKRKRPFDFSKYPKMHVAFKLLYFGWEYQGFAALEESCDTIEHHLFAALHKSCLVESKETCNYFRCGRTDKTVSAFDQVISLTVRAAKEGEPPLEYCKMLNSLLPNNIIVIAWKQVPDGFSARFDCKKRTYKYLFPRGDLDLTAMEKGAAFLIGTHDYRNLCKMDVANGVIEFIRTVDNAGIKVISTNSTLNNPGYDMCEFTLTSKGFLWHQVRCIVGVLVLIGRKLENPEIIQHLLDIEKCPSKPQYGLAIGEPLQLFRCEYEIDGDWEIDRHNLECVMQSLQQQWTLHTVKSTMVSQMIAGIENMMEGQTLCRQSSALIQGNKGKVYTPLLQRPTCESLEARIAHYVEKKRLDINLKKEDKMAA
ncbi:tRNA pseudouridine(38/39) synthase-like [Macrosteles quadrilineatus]|uniref:tRNA pseudouridine(38/39) synthase-like n=1 Tax=Macrosteles quadrilineatus TaxID=74068 RepID=UPI0023E2C87A|nr:tRNA pseudouridine(38/39) synthase-like [Macrosteles quadrilineatus]